MNSNNNEINDENKLKTEISKISQASQIINTIAIFNKMKLKRKQDFQKAIDILLHILLGKDNIYDFLILSISLSQNIIFLWIFRF